MVEVLSQNLLRHRSGNIDLDIHLEERGPAFSRGHTMGFHIEYIYPAVSQKPADLIDNPGMVNP